MRLKLNFRDHLDNYRVDIYFSSGLSLKFSLCWIAYASFFSAFLLCFFENRKFLKNLGSIYKMHNRNSQQQELQDSCHLLPSKIWQDNHESSWYRCGEPCWSGYVRCGSFSIIPKNNRSICQARPRENTWECSVRLPFPLWINISLFSGKRSIKNNLFLLCGGWRYEWTASHSSRIPKTRNP